MCIFFTSDRAGNNGDSWRKIEAPDGRPTFREAGIIHRSPFGKEVLTFIYDDDGERDEENEHGRDRPFVCSRVGELRWQRDRRVDKDFVSSAHGGDENVRPNPHNR